jgi:hypothetical protein
MGATYVVAFQSDRPDSVRALRMVLKLALRRFGLKCIEIKEIKHDSCSVRDVFVNADTIIESTGAAYAGTMAGPQPAIPPGLDTGRRRVVE